MKILLDGRMYGLEHAGIGRYVMNLIDEIVKLDHDNQYIVLLKENYFNLLEFPDNWTKVKADFNHYTVKEQIRLPRILAKFKPDLSHFLHFNVPVFFKGKYVVTIHDLLMQTHRGAKATTLPLYLYYPKHYGAKYVFRAAVKNAYKIIVPSNSVKTEVCNYFKISEEKVDVTYEGFDRRIVKNIPKTEILEKYNLGNQYFLYVGSAYPHKNIEKAIEAILKLNNESSEKIMFAITSARGVFRERIEKLVIKLKAESYVRFLGFVPDEELGVIYKNSLSFIFPSLSEGFGLPGIEAMDQGTILAASDIAVFKEIYDGHAFYFDPYSSDSIKESMQKIIELTKEEREIKIEKAKEYVEKFSWRKMAEETLEVYLSVFNKNTNLNLDK